MKPVRKAVFPVGGLGTRFLPATKAMPKEMLPVVDRPLIQYAVDEAREAGIEQMIFVTGRGKVGLEDYFDIAFELETTMRTRGKSLDVLAPGDPDMLAWIADALPHADFLLPYDEQVLGFTGASSLADGARQLVERGVGCVAVTQGARGALVVTADEVVEVPAYDVEVVDTTGCGDAFSAGFLRGRALGSSFLDAARLGCAVAGLVAGGLGSDFGAFDLAAAQAIVAAG